MFVVTFESIFPMLNSHKKNGFFPKTVLQERFLFFNCFLVNTRYKDWETTCPKGVLLKKIFARL